MALKTLRKRRRIQVIALAVFALVASFTAFYLAAPNALQYFRSPSEVIAEPPPPTEVFRIGGLVEEGSIRRGEGAAMWFRVTDGGAVVEVEYVGILPDLFEEGQGMVGTGTFDGKVFRAQEILAKHDEEYMPKEVMDALKEQGVYQDQTGG